MKNRDIIHRRGYMVFSSAREASVFFYVLIDLFCTSVIGILLYTTLSDVERTTKRLHLVSVFYAIMVYCISDAIWIMTYSNVIIPCNNLNRYLTNIFMYLVMVACVYTITKFFFSIWESVSYKKPIKLNMIFLPLCLMALIVITTPITKLLFSIESRGMLVRGPLYFLFMFFLFGYVIIFSIVSMIFFYNTQNDYAKEQYSFITIYSVPVLLGSSLHYKYWTFPGLAIGFTIATLIIYIFQMRDLICMDGLTGINNRRQGERFFQEQIRRINEEPHSTIDCLYLFMMDLNKFKLINDVYGH